MNYVEKYDAIIRLQNKIRALISAADPEGELARALHHSKEKNPCDQIVWSLLMCRVRRAQRAAQNAASAATRKHYPGVKKRCNMHELTWDLLSSISHLLKEAELPPDDATTIDFASEIRLAQIYNIAHYANSFAGIALNACTLAHPQVTDDDIDEIDDIFLGSDQESLSEFLVN